MQYRKCKSVTEMAEFKSIQTTVNYVAFQAATAVVMVLRKANAGSKQTQDRHADKDMVDQLKTSFI